jgi:hypothetical protein
MAKKANGKQKSMEETLWDSANKLRGTGVCAKTLFLNYILLKIPF